MGRSDQDQRDGGWLKTFAKQVRAALSEAGEDRLDWPRFVPARDTDGFGVLLGDFPRGEVWILLDRYSGHDIRQPWVGVFVKNKSAATRIANHLKRYSRAPRFVQPHEMVVEGRHTRLSQPLRAEDFHQVMVDLFNERGIAVGMHLRRRVPTAEPSRKAALMAARLLADTMLAMEGRARREDDEDGEVESVMLNRVKVSLIRRSGKQAASVKQRDNYTCRICGYRPELQYGAVGRIGLDAHHLDFVGGQRKPISNVARMITVCAVCHRVLHRLPPEERGLTQLRSRFRRIRKAR